MNSYAYLRTRIHYVVSFVVSFVVSSAAEPSDHRRRDSSASDEKRRPAHHTAMMIFASEPGQEWYDAWSGYPVAFIQYEFLCVFTHKNSLCCSGIWSGYWFLLRRRTSLSGDFLMSVRCIYPDFYHDLKQTYYTDDAFSFFRSQDKSLSGSSSFRA